MGWSQKKLYVNVAVPPAPLRVTNQWSLVPSVTSVMCHLMIRVIMIWYRGLWTDLLEFTLQLRKTPAMRPFWRPCDQSSPQMVSLASKWGRWDRRALQEERRKEREKGRGRVLIPPVSGLRILLARSYYLISIICHAHLILLVLIIVIIFDSWIILYSSLLCRFLHLL